MNMDESDLPETCPDCGREAVAIMIDHDGRGGTLYGDDVCEVSDSNIESPLGWYVAVFYVHGRTEEERRA